MSIDSSVEKIKLLANIPIQMLLNSLFKLVFYTKTSLFFMIEIKLQMQSFQQSVKVISIAQLNSCFNKNLFTC